MAKAFVRLFLALALLAVSTAVLGQSLPTSQPKLLTIYREQVKIGHVAAHEKNEVGWPAAFAQAKSPDYYLAMESITGSPEVWFASPWQSYDAWGKSMARDESNAELSAALARLSEADAAHLEGLSVIEAVAMPEASHGIFPDLAKVRFWEITIMRVRPGHEARFVAAAKVYKAAAGRVDSKAGWRVYSVTAGMPGPAFIIFSSTESFGHFDDMLASGEKSMSAMTPEEMKTMDSFARDSLTSVVTNRFRLNPVMSYVSAEVKAADPAFWRVR